MTTEPKKRLENDCIDGTFCGGSPGSGSVDRNDDGGPDAVDNAAAEEAAEKFSDQIGQQGLTAGGALDNYVTEATPEHPIGDFNPTPEPSPFDSTAWSISKSLNCVLAGAAAGIAAKVAMNVTGPVGKALDLAFGNRIAAGVGVMGTLACEVITDRLEQAAREAADALEHRQGDVSHAEPIIFDLGRDGFEFTSAYESGVSWNIDGVGANENIGWVGRDEGILVLDFDQDGPDKPNEFVLTSTLKDAKTDLDALRRADLDVDGFFDSGDAAWRFAKIWQDIDGNGRLSAGDTYKRPFEWGIDKIPLHYTGGIAIDAANGNIIYGTTRFLCDGKTFEMADVAFAIAGRSAYRDLVLPVDDTHIGGAGRDTLAGRAGDDTLLGGGEADRLIGGDGDDWIEGHTAGDLLFGGTGDDVLIGGEGADRFVIEGIGFGTDRILGFQKGVDNLDLSAPAIGFDTLAEVKAASHISASGLYIDIPGTAAVIINGFDSVNDLLGSDVLL